MKLFLIKKFTRFKLENFNGHIINLPTFNKIKNVVICDIKFGICIESQHFIVAEKVTTRQECYVKSYSTLRL